MSIAVHTRAWAESANTTTEERERVWTAYAPRPDRRTPGNPPSHSPASGRYDVANGGIVEAGAGEYPPMNKRASHGGRMRIAHAVRAAKPAVETAQVHPRFPSCQRARSRTHLPPDKA